MMEEEINRTKEEIKGIEEACEKVEEVLEKVIESRELNGAVDLIQDFNAEGEDGKMEDVVQEGEVNGDENKGGCEILQSNWFDDESLLNVWNGSGQ